MKKTEKLSRTAAMLLGIGSLLFACKTIPHDEQSQIVLTTAETSQPSVTEALAPTSTTVSVELIAPETTTGSSDLSDTVSSVTPDVVLKEQVIASLGSIGFQLTPDILSDITMPADMVVTPTNQDSCSLDFSYQVGVTYDPSQDTSAYISMQFIAPTDIFQLDSDEYTRALFDPGSVQGVHQETNSFIEFDPNNIEPALDFINGLQQFCVTASENAEG